MWKVNMEVMNWFLIKSKSIGVSALVVAGLFWTGCSNKVEIQQSEDQPINAEIITLQPEKATIEQAYPASLEGKVNVEIRPQINGYIDKIYIDEGAFVKAGKPLFRINASVYKEQKNTAMAALEVAKSQLASTELELEKYEILRERKIVADFQYQKAKSNYESAKASVNQQKALVASSDLNLDFTIVKAPVSGYIGRIPHRIGSLVSPADVRALTTLSQVDEVYAYFSIPETEILKINETREGSTLLQKLQTFQDVVLLMANGNPYSHTGKIDMVDGQFDRSTGSVTLRASFPNPQSLLRSGNTGRIVLKSQQDNVFKIPVLATYEVQDKLFVGMLDDKNQLERVELKEYHKSGDFYILKSGFKPGDRIIASEMAVIPEKSVIIPEEVN